jgi:hypothetical protein
MDSWRLRIQHQSGFDYAGPVSSSYNEARMWPRNDGRQAVLDLQPPAVHQRRAHATTAPRTQLTAVVCRK